MRGSECNDRYTDFSGTTATNHSGGINGGISKGTTSFPVAVKPASSISLPQQTLNFKTGIMRILKYRAGMMRVIALRMPCDHRSRNSLCLADMMLQAYSR
jgi:chorismate synthase